MSVGLDAVLEQLLDEVALAGSQGFDAQTFRDAVKRVYERSTASNQDANSQDLLFSDVPPGHVVSVDDGLLTSLFDSLCEYPDIEIKTTAAETVQPDSSEIDAHSDIPDLKAKFFNRRLVTSADRVWHAIAGHGIDHKRLPPLEFECLSTIAAHGPAGILQPNLTKLTGQDKRSVPKRTDNLVKKGYITKEGVVGTGSKTSLLRLQKYAQEKNEDPVEHSKLNSAAQTASQEVVFYEGWFDETIRMLKENNNIISLKDLRLGLGIHLKKLPGKFLIRCLRRLESEGCIRTLTARVEDQNGNALKQVTGRVQKAKSIQLVREPTDRDRDLWSNKNQLKPPTAWNGQLGGNDSGHEEHPPQFADDEDDNGDDDEMSDVEVVPNDLEVAEWHVPPQWTPDLPYPNLVYNIVNAAGKEGISSMDLAKRLGGPLWRRPIDEIMGRLTDIWQVSQPPHLRHLSVVRDTALHGKWTHWQYRSLPNFEKAVDANEAVLVPTSGAPKSGRKSHKKKAVASVELDHWGFPKYSAKDFADRTGRATLAECRKMIPLESARAGNDESDAVHDVESGDEDLSDHEALATLDGDLPDKVNRRRSKKGAVAKQRQHPGSIRKEAEAFDKWAQDMAERKAMIEIKNSKKRDSEVAGLDDSNDTHRNKVSRTEEITTYKTKNNSRAGRKRAAEVSGLEEGDCHRSNKSRRIESTTNDETGETIRAADLLPGRVAELKAEILSREKPGVYMNPPGSLALKLENFIQLGRPPKSLIAVIKNERLRELPWFQRRERMSRTSAANHQLVSATDRPTGLELEIQSRIVPATSPTSRQNSTPRDSADRDVTFENAMHQNASNQGATHLRFSLPRTGDESSSEALEEDRLQAIHNRINELRRKRGRRTKLAQAEMAQLQSELATYGEARDDRILQSAHGNETFNRHEDLASPKAPLTSEAQPESHVLHSDKENGAGSEPKTSPLGTSFPEQRKNMATSNSAPEPAHERSSRPLGLAQQPQENGSEPTVLNATEMKSPKLDESVPKTAKKPRMGGTVLAQRQQIIMDAVGRCHGVFPGNHEPWYVFVTAWKKQHGQTPDKNTVDRAITSLIQNGKLKKWTIQFRTAKGFVVTQSILAEPHIDQQAPVFQQLYSKMREKHPAQYLPPEVEVDETLRLQAVNPRSRKKREMANPETAEIQSDRSSAPPNARQQFPLDVTTSVRQTSISAANADTEARNQGFADAREQFLYKRAQKKASDAMLQQKYAKKWRSSLIQDSDDSGDDDDAEIDENQATMQGSFQVEGYTHDLLAALQPKRTSRTRLSRRLRFDEGAPVVFPRQPLGSLRSLGSARRNIGRSSGSYRMRPVESLSVDNYRPRNYEWLQNHGADLRSLNFALQQIRRGKRHPGYNLASEDPERFQNDALALVMDTTQHFHTPTGTFGTITGQSQSTTSTAFRDISSLVSGYKNNFQVTPRTVHDILERAKSLGYAPASSQDPKAFQFFRDVDRVQEWEMALIRSGYQFYDIDEWIFINLGLNCPHNCPNLEITSPMVISFEYQPLPGLSTPTVNESWRAENRISIVRPSNTPFAVTTAPGLTANSQPAILSEWKGKYVSRKKRTGQQEDLHTSNAESTLGSSVLEAAPNEKVLRKRDRQSGLDFKDHERLVIAVAIVYALCGGLNQNRLNWSLVAHALGYRYEGEFLRRRWAGMRGARNYDAELLAKAIRQPFLEAYEQGHLPRVDFEDPTNTDWPAQFEWVQANVIPVEETGPDAPDLPPSLEELEAEYVIDEHYLPPRDADTYFTSTTDQRRKELAYQFAHSTPVRGPVTAARKTSSSSILLNSWIRAIAATKQRNYNATAAADKIKMFSNDQLDQTTKEMVEDRVLCQEKKGRQLPGRNYQLHNDMLSQFRRWPGKNDEYLFLRKVAQARTLIVQHFETESEFRLVPTAADSLYLVMMNMVAQGLLSIEILLPETKTDFDAPFPKLSPWGYSGYSYETKKTDIARLRFPILFRKTAAYTPRHGLVPGVPTPVLPAGTRFEGDPTAPRLPFWIDIHGNRLDDIWDMVVRSLLHLLVFRPGSTPPAMERAHKGKFLVWEIELVLQWMQTVGLAVTNGDGGGWRAGEWWYCAFVPEVATWKHPAAVADGYTTKK